MKKVKEEEGEEQGDQDAAGWLKSGAWSLAS